MELSQVDDVFGELLNVRNRHLDDSGTKRGNVANRRHFIAFFVVKYETVLCDGFWVVPAVSIYKKRRAKITRKLDVANRTVE